MALGGVAGGLTDCLARMAKTTISLKLAAIIAKATTATTRKAIHSKSENLGKSLAKIMRSANAIPMTATLRAIVRLQRLLSRCASMPAFYPGVRMAGKHILTDNNPATMLGPLR